MPRGSQATGRVSKPPTTRTRGAGLEETRITTRRQVRAPKTQTNTTRGAAEAARAVETPARRTRRASNVETLAMDNRAVRPQEALATTRSAAREEEPSRHSSRAVQRGHNVPHYLTIVRDLQGISEILMMLRDVIRDGGLDELRERPGELSPVWGSSWDFVAAQNRRRLARRRHKLKGITLLAVVAAVVYAACHVMDLAIRLDDAESALEEGYDSYSDDSILDELIFDDSDLDDFESSDED